MEVRGLGDTLNPPLPPPPSLGTPLLVWILVLPSYRADMSPRGRDGGKRKSLGGRMFPRLVREFHILHCFGMYFSPPCRFSSPLLRSHFFPSQTHSHFPCSRLFLPAFFFSLQPVPSHLSYWSVTCDDVLRFWGISLALSAGPRVCVS